MKHHFVQLGLLIHFDSKVQHCLILCMSFMNKIVASSLPFLPQWFAKPFATPYVAGETFDEAKSHIRALNEKGFKTTIDILGEHVLDQQQARSITQHYCDLYHYISEENLDCNVSVKPTHIGLDISLAEAMANVHRITKAAKDTDNFLRLDMENSPFTDATLELYSHCINIHPKSGVVFQAYLHRSFEDVRIHMSSQFNARICKGIYKESETIAYQHNYEIVENFIRLAQTILKGSGYCAIATHDIDLIDTLVSWIEDNHIPIHRFEFQVLYGVPMSGKLEALLSKGYTVRIYVPFGSAWFDYSIRRLKENPSILGYVIKNLFKQK